MTPTVDGVWVHIVADIPKPGEAPPNRNKPPISQEVYDQVAQGTVTELEVRLHLAQVDRSLWDHLLLKDACEMMIAARLLRRLRTYQEVADSLFADANIKLRLFFEGVAGRSEQGTGIGLVVIEESGVDQAQRPWLADPNDLVDGFLKSQDKPDRDKVE